MSRPVDVGARSMPLHFTRLLLCLCLSFVCLSFCFISPAQAVNTFDGMSDQELLERAIRIYRQEGDCEWAIRAYHELLSRQTSEHVQVAALYNQAICFERRLFWQEALANYREIQQRYPRAQAALDAQFREGVMLELLGRFSDAEKRFGAMPTSHPQLTDADERAIQVQVGWQQLMQGKDKKAVRTLQKVLDAWEALPPEELKPERFYQGKLHLALGMVLSRYAERATLAPEGAFGPEAGAWWSLRLARLTRHEDQWLKAQRTEREKRLTAAQHHYALARETGIPLWMSAVVYCMGLDAESFYHALNDAEPPAYLTPSQRTLYSTRLREVTRDYLVTAAQLYLAGQEQAVAQQDSSAWAHLLERKASQIEALGVDSLGRLNEGPGPMGAGTGKSGRGPSSGRKGPNAGHRFWSEPWKGDLGGEKAELIP